MYPDDDDDDAQADDRTVATAATSASASSPTSPPLPQGWYRVVDPNNPGSTYFLHAETQKMVGSLFEVYKKSPSPDAVASARVTPCNFQPDHIQSLSASSFWTPMKRVGGVGGSADKPITCMDSDDEDDDEDDDESESQVLAVLSDAESDFTDSQVPKVNKQRPSVADLLAAESEEEIADDDGII